MIGFKTFERALDGGGDGTMTAATRRELCYCAMCCSAAFGDVEAAKMYLREMQAFGLDFEMAIADPRLMKMESSALMKNQLKKSSKTLQLVQPLQPVQLLPPRQL